MRIVIAEDDAVSRQILVGHLRNWGYHVTETSNGTQALEALKTDEFSMAILDWMMPEMDGVEVVRRIRRQRGLGYVYMILLTAKAQKADLVAGFEAGADDYLTKPFDREELRVRVLSGRRILQLQSRLMRVEKSEGIAMVAMGLARELAQPVDRLHENLCVLRGEILSDGKPPSTSLDNYDVTDSSSDAPIAPAKKECDAEAMAELFSQSLEVTTRMLDMLRNLRDFAHIDPIIMKPVAIPAALRDIISLMPEQLEIKDIDLQLHLANVPAVYGNPGKLKKVFYHLLRNAVEAVSRGGTIAVLAAHEPGQVVIQIQDNGQGIESERLSHIFEPFEATRTSPEGGIGLGLAISSNIIREHGGLLEVASIVDQGTTFTVRLPAMVPQVSVSPVVMKAGASPATSA